MTSMLRVKYNTKKMQNLSEEILRKRPTKTDQTIIYVANREVKIIKKEKDSYTTIYQRYQQ